MVMQVSVPAGMLLPFGERVVLTRAESCEMLNNLPVIQVLLLTSSSSWNGAAVLAAPPMSTFMAEADVFHSSVLFKKRWFRKIHFCSYETILKEAYHYLITIRKSPCSLDSVCWFPKCEQTVKRNFTVSILSVYTYEIYKKKLLVFASFEVQSIL